MRPLSIACQSAGVSIVCWHAKNAHAILVHNVVAKTFFIHISNSNKSSANNVSEVLKRKENVLISRLLSHKLTACQAVSLSLPIAVSLRLNNS